MPRRSRRTDGDVLTAVPRPRTARPMATIPTQRPAPPDDGKPDLAPGGSLPKAAGPAPRRARGAMRRLPRIVSGVLLLVAMLGSLTAMVTVMTQHLGFAPVLSPSMVPTFRPGDLVITRPEPAASIKVGQVIALPVPAAPGQRYVHRVISVTSRDGRPLVQTKGDANAAPEAFMLRIDSRTVPVVVARVPLMGRLSILLQHTKTRLAVVAITVAAILLSGWRLFAGARRSPPKPTGGAGRHRR